MLRGADQAGSSTGHAQRLQEAVTLYQGELLPGYDENWIPPERLRLTDAFPQALQRLIAHLESASRLVP